MGKYKVEIYTDGACSCNPGIGGWAAVCKINEKIMKVCGGVEHATNNGMELRAALEALKALTVPCDVKIISDSKYMIEALTKHTIAWIKTPGRKNADLMLEIIKVAKNGKHNVTFVKIPAHAGNKMNELADKLAKAEIVKLRHKMYGGK